MLRAVVARAGIAMSVGAGVGLLAVGVDRLIGPGLSRQACWGLAGACTGAGLLWSLARAWIDRQVGLRALHTVDLSMGLKERLSSALALGSVGSGDPFVGLAASEAEQLTGQVALTRAIPIRFGNSWAAWPVLLAGACSLALLEPMRLLTDTGARERQAAAVTEKAQATEAVEEAQREIQRLSGGNPDDAVADLVPPERLEALEKLKQQLASGGSTPDDARAEAAGALQKTADDLEEKAQAQADADEQSKSMLAKLPKPPTNGPNRAESAAARQLAQALRDGNAEEASRAADELGDRLDSMSDEERREASERLESLSKQLEEIAKAQDQEKREDDSDDLSRQGLPEQEVEKLRRMTDPEQIRKALQDKGVDEPTARKLAERAANENRERLAKEQASDQAKSLSESLKKAADEVKQPPEKKPERGEAPKPGAEKPAKSPEQQTNPDNQKQPNPDQAKPDPNSSDANKSESAKSDPMKPGESKQGQSKPDSSKTDPSKSDPSKSDPSRSDPSKQDGSKSDESKDGPPKADPTKKDQSAPGDGKAQPKGEPRPEESKQGETKSGESKQGESKSGEPKPGDRPDGAAKKQSGDPSKAPTKDAPQSKDAPKGEPRSGDNSNKPGSEKAPTTSPKGIATGDEQKQSKDAKSGREQQGGEKSGSQQQPGQKPGGEKPGDSGQDGAKQPGEKPGSQPSPGGSPKPDGKQSGDKPGSQPGEGQPGQPGEAPGQKPGEKPSGGGNSGAEKGTAPAAQPQGRQLGAGNDRPQEKGASPGEGHKQPEQPGAKPDGQGTAHEQEKQAHGDGDGAGGHGAGSSPAGGIDRVREQLKQMAKSPAEAKRRLDESRKLREQAEKMLAEMSPEERSKLEQLAREKARESGGSLARAAGDGGGPSPFTSAPVDFRAKNQGEAKAGGPQPEVLGKIDDPNAPPARSGVSNRPSAEPTARQALEGAQKAVEKKSIPARYKNVEKYFKKAVEREESKAPAAQPAPPAADAPDTKAAPKP